MQQNEGTLMTRSRIGCFVFVQASNPVPEGTPMTPLSDDFSFSFEEMEAYGLRSSTRQR
jgi:hypothetical protein